MGRGACADKCRVIGGDDRMIADTPQRVRIPHWWLSLLRRLMGLGAGEHVIVLTVLPDGRRSARVVTLPEGCSEL